MKKPFFFFFLFAGFVTASAQSANSTTPKINPVLRTYVPPAIVDKAIKRYGKELYCIAQVKTTDGAIAYVVGLIHNGKLTTDLMTEDLKIAFASPKPRQKIIRDAS